jgi:hypothetical protein
VKRNDRLGEVFELDVAAYVEAQCAIGHEVVALSAQAADERAHADREDILALKAAPDASELLGGLRGLRP